MHTIGIDIGGTKISFVLLKRQRVARVQKISTPATAKDLIEAVKHHIKEFSKSGSLKIDGIGIGVPGPLNEKGDLVLNPPNLKALRDCPLSKIIQKAVGIKTKMDNDVNCFTLGEALLGSGRGAKIVFGITLGTGVGGGIVIDGKIYRGAFGSAGEVGHTTIKFDGPTCSCFNLGCFEEYVSERSKAGDFKEYGKYLGIGLSNVINLLDPEVIVIGGGIGVNKYQSFIKSAKDEIGKRAFSPVSKKNVKIKKAALGEFGGAIGAALLNKYA